MVLFLEFRNKIFPATQNSPEDLSRTRPATLSFLFRLTISRPPRGTLKPKKVLQTSAKRSQPAHPTTLTQHPGTAGTSHKPLNPDSLSIQDLPTRFSTKNVLNRLPDALPGPAK